MENLFNHKFILFVGDHYNPLNVARSLGIKGIYSYVILVQSEGKPHMLNNCRYVKTCKIVKTMEEGLDYLLHTFGNEDNKPFLYTSDDGIGSFLDLNYNVLIDHFHFFNCGEEGLLTKMMAKSAMRKLAEECNLRVPITELVNVGQLPKVVSYPLLTKAVISTEGNWKAKVHICRNEEELLDAYKQIGKGKIELQEYIEKDNELCLDGISLNGGEELYIPLQCKYLRMTSKSYGNYMYFEQYKEPELLEKMKDLFKKTHYSGIFSIEFLIDKNGNFYFLEINFRNSTWIYANTKCGANLPYIYAQSVLNGYLDNSSEKIKKTPFIAMNEISDFIISIQHRQVGLFKWIKQVRKCDCLYYYDKDDPRPFYKELKHQIKYILSKIPKKLFG